MFIFSKAKTMEMVKKTQSIEANNPTFFLAFSHPDLFLPYIVAKFIIHNLVLLYFKVKGKNLTN